MKMNKRLNIYDPNLIWACSVDLREKPDQPAQVRQDAEIQPENIMPPHSNLDLDNSKTENIN